MSLTSTTHSQTSSRPTAVLKFGGSVLRDQASLAQVVGEIDRWRAQGIRVVAVVSAFKGETDRLVKKSAEFLPGVDEPASALLTGTGELTSASLLVLALKKAGLDATVATPWTIGLRAHGSALDAFPHAVDRFAVERLLGEHGVVVVPGFIGSDHDHRLVLLGRGGSDLTALFLAEHLGADRCRLVKDVDGLYERDPARHAPGLPPARRYRSVSWSHALTLGSEIVQPKAIRHARERGLTFEVGAIGTVEATLVGDQPVEFANEPAEALAIA